MDTQASMNSPKISVVIGSYNQKKVLKKVLEGFNKQKCSIGFEVLVCDSGSTDGSHELFNSFSTNFKFRPYIKENQGKAAARNLGIQNANAPIILITDSDMIPHENLIETHYRAHQKIKHPACFEGCTYNLSHYHFPVYKQNTFPYISSQPKSFQKVNWFHFLTGNISIPTDLIRGAKGFDENFSNYGWEDLELGYRLVKKEKVALYYLPLAKNYHYHIISKNDDISRCQLKGESAKIFIEKHPELKVELGIHPLSKSAYLFNKKYPDFLKWVTLKGLKSSSQKIRSLSLWYAKESKYWEGLFN